MTKSVFCLASNEEQARRIVDHLISAEFSNDDISLLYPEGHKDHDKKGHLTTEKHTKAPEGGATGAATGGILGGSLGLLAGIGALAIPGMGPFIAAGPIMAALSGSAVGGGLGLFLGSLIGFGIPEFEAKKYETGLKQGNILISVHTESSDEINHASEIMKKEGGKDISSSREKVKDSH